MNFNELLQFVERDMRMSHVCQPVMLRELLNRNGRATVAEIARAGALSGGRNDGLADQSTSEQPEE